MREHDQQSATGPRPTPDRFSEPVLLRYVGRFDGATESGADGTEAPASVLPFRATVDGRHGIDMLHFDASGRIKEFTVMVRPQSAVHTLGQAVLAGLQADGLA